MFKCLFCRAAWVVEHWRVQIKKKLLVIWTPGATKHREDFSKIDHGLLYFFIILLKVVFKTLIERLQYKNTYLSYLYFSRKSVWIMTYTSDHFNQNKLKSIKLLCLYQKYIYRFFSSSYSTHSRWMYIYKKTSLGHVKIYGCIALFLVFLLWWAMGSVHFL